MGRVDFDPERAFETVRPFMVARAETIGAESAAHAQAIAPRKTGTLARSIGWVALAGSKTLVAVRFGTDLLYGRFQEIGTWKMPPRSFLRRTAMDLLDRYKQIARRGE